MELTAPLKGMIGLEIHVYLVTREKLFCRCTASREKGLQPNVYICPICTGQPGAKPLAPNGVAVEQAVSIALMLGCTVQTQMWWQRKHYSWPDLPKGYQSTLSGTRADPVGVGGEYQGIRIRSMHLEEDPAAWDPETGHVDYNRSGLPLVEIITEPDFTSDKDVMTWLEGLLHHLKYLKAVGSDAGIKVDVNVSIPGKSERVEVKNVNSIESIGLAIQYELERQMREGSSVKETRRFDALKQKTVVMREKEGDADYRFLLDPDLTPLVLESTLIEKLHSALPLSPSETLVRLITQYNLPEGDARIISADIDVVRFFEDVARKVPASFAANWIMGSLLRLLNEHSTTLDALSISSEHFSEVLELVRSGTITELQGKKFIKEFYPASFSVKSRNVAGKISDVSALEKVVRDVIADNPSAVSTYKSGDQKVLNFLLGEVMKRTEKRADFAATKILFEQLLR